MRTVFWLTGITLAAAALATVAVADYVYRHPQSRLGRSVACLVCDAVPTTAPRGTPAAGTSATCAPTAPEPWVDPDEPIVVGKTRTIEDGLAQEPRSATHGFAETREPVRTVPIVRTSATTSAEGVQPAKYAEPEDEFTYPKTPTTEPVHLDNVVAGHRPVGDPSDLDIPIRTSSFVTKCATDDCPQACSPCPEEQCSASADGKHGSLKFGIGVGKDDNGKPSLKFVCELVLNKKEECTKAEAKTFDVDIVLDDVKAVTKDIECDLECTGCPGKLVCRSLCEMIAGCLSGSSCRVGTCEIEVCCPSEDRCGQIGCRAECKDEAKCGKDCCCKGECKCCATTATCCQEKCCETALVRKVYPVGDLLDLRQANDHESLMSMVMRHVPSKQWCCYEKGTCCMDYFARGKCLIVSQTPEVHAEVEAFLNELRGAVKKTVGDVPMPMQQVGFDFNVQPFCVPMPPMPAPGVRVPPPCPMPMPGVPCTPQLAPCPMPMGACPQPADFEPCGDNDGFLILDGEDSQTQFEITCDDGTVLRARYVRMPGFGGCNMKVKVVSSKKCADTPQVTRKATGSAVCPANYVEAECCELATKACPPCKDECPLVVRVRVEDGMTDVELTKGTNTCRAHLSTPPNQESSSPVMAVDWLGQKVLFIVTHVPAETPTATDDLQVDFFIHGLIPLTEPPTPEQLPTCVDPFLFWLTGFFAPLGGDTGEFFWLVPVTEPPTPEQLPNLVEPLFQSRYPGHEAVCPYTGGVYRLRGGCYYYGVYTPIERRSPDDGAEASPPSEEEAIEAEFKTITPPVLPDVDTTEIRPTDVMPPAAPIVGV